MRLKSNADQDDVLEATAVHVTTVRALDDFRNNPHGAASMVCHVKLHHILKLNHFIVYLSLI